MSLYRRGETWWCKFKVGGEVLRQSTGESNYRRAQTVERRLRAEADTKAPARVGHSPPLSEYAARDIHRAEIKGTTPEHLKILQQRWARTIASLGDPCIDTIDGQTLADYVSTRRAQKVRGQTIRREVTDIRRAMLLAVDQNVLTALPKPWPVIRTDPPSVAQAGKLHSEEALRAVLEAVPVDVREACAFCYATGLRFSELRRVRASWLERPKYESKVPYVLRLPRDATKSRKERVVGVPQELAELVLRRAEEMGDLVFPRGGYRKALAIACARIGYAQTITLRDLRHMFASEALKRSGDIQAVSNALGHSALTTTALYLHAHEVDVVNLAAPRGTERGHSRERGTAPKQYKHLKPKRKMERETGLEPATPSLGSFSFVDFADLLRANTGKNTPQNAAICTPGGTTRGHNGQRGHSENSWVKCRCQKCGVVEVLSPITACPLCDGTIFQCEPRNSAQP
jgi:integrase/recombinase XerD